MKSISFIFMCALWLVGCQNNAPTSNQNSVETVDSIKTTPTNNTVYSRPTLLHTTEVDTMGIPRTVVSYAMGTQVEKIDTAVMGEFNLMSTEDMKNSKMPSSYIVAGKAFYVGLQEIIVIDSTAKGYVVKRQYQDEGSSGHEPFEVVKEFPK